MIYSNKILCYIAATILSYRQINVQKWVVFGVKNEKTYGLTLFNFFIKMRALWSRLIKNNIFLGFLKSFSKMDIYKCPKSVFGSKIGKKVYVLFIHPFRTFYDEVIMFVLL
jgi:hypothetical protein